MVFQSKIDNGYLGVEILLFSPDLSLEMSTAAFVANLEAARAARAAVASLEAAHASPQNPQAEGILAAFARLSVPPQAQTPWADTIDAAAAAAAAADADAAAAAAAADDADAAAAAEDAAIAEFAAFEALEAKKEAARQAHRTNPKFQAFMAAKKDAASTESESDDNTAVQQRHGQRRAGRAPSPAPPQQHHAGRAPSPAPQRGGTETIPCKHDSKEGGCHYPECKFLHRNHRGTPKSKPTKTTPKSIIPGASVDAAMVEAVAARVAQMMGASAPVVDPRRQQQQFQAPQGHPLPQPQLQRPQPPMAQYPQAQYPQHQQGPNPSETPCRYGTGCTRQFQGCAYAHPPPQHQQPGAPYPPPPQRGQSPGPGRRFPPQHQQAGAPYYPPPQQAGAPYYPPPPQQPRGRSPAPNRRFPNPQVGGFQPVGGAPYYPQY